MNHGTGSGGEVAKRLGQYGVALGRVESGLKLCLGSSIAVEGPARNPAEVCVFEQFTDHCLEQLGVRHRVESLDDIACRLDLGTPDEHPAEFGDEAGTGLDDGAGAELRGHRRARFLEPATIFGQKILEFAAIVAGAREEVVAGTRIQFYNR